VTADADRRPSHSPFGARLLAALADRGPLCAGIDPHPGLLAAWELPDDPIGLERFSTACVTALGGEVAVLKPQSAFFERHGAAGIAVLERVIAAARDAGALVLLDAKRGDIGSTMEAYAQAYLAEGAPLGVDAITLSPYLGVGSLRPALDAAAANGRGTFLLARTSNPEGAEVQLAVPPNGGRSLAQAVVDAAAQHNAAEQPLGAVGVVVGATVEHGLDLGALNGAVLAPGFGAQGARPGDLSKHFPRVAGPVLPTVSRDLLRTGPHPGALRDAARRLRDAFAAAPSDHGS
jgi:orotidine-5'-phosphate decarboxylase